MSVCKAWGVRGGEDYIYLWDVNLMENSNTSRWVLCL